MGNCHKPLLILMGPTASGKSALGVSIAKRIGGAILNADAMQCYADLSIITARPSDDEMQGVPHHLYGIWSARTLGNAALWLRAATEKIHQVHAEGQIPILLGGTGMYLKGLTQGLSPVPPISEAVCAQVKALPNLYHTLKQHDPRMAERLEPNDTQRIARALEVVLETGQSLLDWQERQAPAPLNAAQCYTAIIEIPREVLYARINARFEQMLQRGALEEVAALKAQFSPEEMAKQRFPLLKAHGVPELLAHLDGQMTLAEAMTKGQQNTRNYAKRQMTWLRGQVLGATALPYEGGEAVLEQWLESVAFG